MGVLGAGGGRVSRTRGGDLAAESLQPSAPRLPPESGSEGAKRPPESGAGQRWMAQALFCSSSPTFDAAPLVRARSLGKSLRRLLVSGRKLLTAVQLLACAKKKENTRISARLLERAYASARRHCTGRRGTLYIKSEPCGEAENRLGIKLVGFTNTQKSQKRVKGSEINFVLRYLFIYLF